MSFDQSDFSSCQNPPSYTPLIHIQYDKFLIFIATDIRWRGQTAILLQIQDPKRSHQNRLVNFRAFSGQDSMQAPQA